MISADIWNAQSSHISIIITIIVVIIIIIVIIILLLISLSFIIFDKVRKQLTLVRRGSE